MAKKISKQVKKAKETKIVKKVEKKSPKPVPAKKKQTAKAKPAKKVVQKVAKSKVAKPKPQKKTEKVSKRKAKPEVIAQVNDSSVDNDAPLPPAAVESEIPLKYSYYTVEQYRDYVKHVNELRTYSNKMLQDELAKNLQSKTGTKDELIVKVADGRVKGGIPRCPGCFGGRPKYDQRKGEYHCPGYRDDTDFVNCHRVFLDHQITRLEWNK